MAIRRWIGDALLSAGLVTRQQIDQAAAVQSTSGQKLGQALVALGYLDESALLKTLCDDAGIPYLDDAEIAPDPEAVALMPPEFARQHGAVPLRLESRHIVVAMADPFDLLSIRALTRAAGRSVRVVGGRRDAILRAIERAYTSSAAAGMMAAAVAVGGAVAPRLEVTRGGEAAGRPGARSARPGAAADSVRTEEDANAPGVVDEIIRRGVDMAASDIHVEPLEDSIRIRYRIDGLLTDGGAFPKTAQAALVGRVKVLAGLDVADARLPQEGHARLRFAQRSVDLRVSTYPTLHGEDIVLRVLDRGRVALQLEKLGIESDDLLLLRTALQRSHGLVPVTGPTDSGRTTTLYAALAELNTGERSVVTIEDPIEYEMANVRQSQVNVRAGLTFASGLTSILRHDPDIILVGEMRDRETVETALNAALSGRLVLTTLHSTTTAGTIPRLLDMGAEPFVIASAIPMLVSQRLVRVLCANCKAKVDMPAAVRKRFELEDAALCGPKGCDACRQTGFRGRVGIFELLPMSQDIVTAIHERTPPEQILRESGRPSLLQEGIRKVRNGITTLDELLRVTA